MKKAHAKGQQYSDEETAVLAQSGDISATNSLLTKYKSTVSMITRRFFLVGADDEDLLQEGMIGLTRAISTYNKGSGVPFGAYANMCIKSAVMDAVKSASRDKHKPLNDYLPVEDNEIPASGLDPETIAIKNEASESFRQACERVLNDKQNEILALYMEGYSYKQIAEKTNSNTKSVDNCITQIKLKLKKELA